MNNKPKLQNKGTMQCVFQQIPQHSVAFFILYFHWCWIQYKKVPFP